MSEPAIQVENLSKAYQIGLKEEIPDTFTSMLSSWAKSPVANWKRLKKLNTFQKNGSDEEPDDIIWALKDVSFDVQEGEVVGIIGRNGAGKSTLLKILSRITEPTSGRAVIRGRVSSLLEVGTGFHPELTGRENVYMNGTILGMRKKEIDRKFDEIVEFSGVEKFLDTPIKRYSSGMKVRLAFSVAAHLEPEILIIDEVLAVGDMQFQRQCLGKMKDVAHSGRTVLFVSHNIAAIKMLCSSAILIHHGRAVVNGTTQEAVSKYSEQSSSTSCSLGNRTDRTGNGTVRLLDISFGSNNDPETGQWVTGEDVLLRVAFQIIDPQSITSLDIAIGVRTHDDRPLFYLSTRILDTQLEPRNKSGCFRCKIPKLPLEPGTYRFNIEVLADSQKADHITDAALVEVACGDFFGTGRMSSYGGGVCEHHWSLEDNIGIKKNEIRV